MEYCKGALPSDLNFKGLKIALDCANGASYQVAPQVFQELGAEVSIMHNLPNGFNINENCGSTHMSDLAKFVVEEGCDLGVAFDGDADRVLMVDNNGNMVDGDQLIYVLATTAQKEGTLNGGGVVGTLMTNLGLEKRFEELSIPFVRANVGDRYVLQELKVNKWVYGGESSGHIICLDKTTTGDGLLSAILVVKAILTRKESLADIVAEYAIFPQRMINVKLSSTEVPASEICNNNDVLAAVKEVEEKMTGSGRVLLRPSGTEPLIRVMVEGDDKAMVDTHCEALAEQVSSYC